MPGFTVGSIVDSVNKRTEGRAADKIDMRIEFFLALAEFCNEQHYWWRKRRGQVSLNIGDASKDLSAITPDLAEFDEVLLVNPDGVTIAGELTPIQKGSQQLEMILNNVQGIPSAYFLDTETSLQTIQLNAPSSVAQKLVYTYWAQPIMTDPGEDAIPFIPFWLHYGTGYCLEKRVFEFLFGQEDPRFMVAKANVDKFRTEASRTSTWANGVTSSARANHQGIRAVKARGR